MIEHIQNHAQFIANYQQPAIQWAYKRNGNLTATAEYAQNHGALDGIELDPLTRHDVVVYFEQDIYRGFIATMLWGGKKRGFHTIVDADKEVIIEKLQRLRDLLIQGKITDAFISMCRGGENHIDRVDYAFFTKLFYFMCKAYAPNILPQPLILDIHMIYVHCALLLDEYHNGHLLYRWRDRYGLLWYNNQCAADAYVDYVERMQNISNSINVTAEKLEEYLFSLQPANANSFIYQEVWNQRALL